MSVPKPQRQRWQVLARALTVIDPMPRRLRVISRVRDEWPRFSRCYVSVPPDLPHEGRGEQARHRSANDAVAAGPPRRGSNRHRLNPTAPCGKIKSCGLCVTPPPPRLAEIWPSSLPRLWLPRACGDPRSPAPWRRRSRPAPDGVRCREGATSFAGQA
jgi:hypothetical protein